MYGRNGLKNKCVLTSFLKSSHDLIVLILSGKLFHSVGPETLNNLLAKVFNLVLGIISPSVSSDERKFLSGHGTLTSKSLRYLGALPLRHRCTVMSILEVILSLIEIQCNSFKLLWHCRTSHG